MTNVQNRKRWAISQQKKARTTWITQQLETWDTVQLEGLHRMYFNIQLSALMRGFPFAKGAPR